MKAIRCNTIVMNKRYRNKGWREMTQAYKDTLLRMH